MPSTRLDPPWVIWSVSELLGLTADKLFEECDGTQPPLGGRGAAWFAEFAGIEAVVRSYRRGGLPARFSRDQFLFAGLARTRPWREWCLTSQLFALGLPVPRPLAAGVKRGAMTYRAGIATARLPGASTLAQMIRLGAVVEWDSLAQTVAAFHRAGVDHVDLNANNVLWSGDRWHLIDFDGCRLRSLAPAWQQRNCARLQRSLRSLELYDAGAWSRFVEAYTDSTAAR